MTSPIRFGTDGVRGRAGDWPITHEGALALGRAVALWARRGDDAPRVLVIRDPRASGGDLEDGAVAGLLDGGAVAHRGGVLPTAAASCAVAEFGLDAAIVLTASHNPWRDNGLKVLARGGGKVLDPGALEGFLGRPRPARFSAGREAPLDGPGGPWREWMPDLDLSGLTVLLDCASGAAHGHADAVLEARGATVIRRDPAPDGENINDGVGAMHPPSAQDVREAGADLALCLDGDADRVLLVDPAQGLLDGDDLLWLFAAGSEAPVVGTVMSNGGLEAALGDRLVRAAVGDRFVAEEMSRTGAPIGAEPSGHVLFADGMPTGDGLYAALRVLEAVAARQGSPVPLPVGGWTRWPQAQTAVRFAGDRLDLTRLTTLDTARAAGNRLVVRYSGTEPKLRILVEGQGSGDDTPQAWCDRIADEFRALAQARPRGFA